MSREARRWFEVFEGAGLDGVVAKPAALPYRQDARVMLKIKHARTADCVVAGFRWHKTGPVVGSLLLGLYDDEGHLQHVGVCGSFTAARRKELLDRARALPDGRPRGSPLGELGQRRRSRAARPGATSRWNAGKDLSWQPLRPELVAEVRVRPHGRATASGTRPSSSAGGPTGTPRPAGTTSSTGPCASTSPPSLPADSRPPTCGR